MLDDLPTTPLTTADHVEHVVVAAESLRSQWRIEARLGTHDRMTLAQLSVHGPMPMSELASRISLSRAAVTSLIDRLEDDGWVRRRADTRDRRRTVLELLPQAVDELARTGDPLKQQINIAVATLSPQDRATIDAFLGTLVSITEEHAQELRSRAPERSLM